MQKKAERRERARVLFQEPGFIDRLAEFISEGGTFRDFTRLPDIDLPYMLVWGWLDEDPDRRKKYNDALTVQNEVHRDIVTGGLVGAAQVDVAAFFDENGEPLNIAEIPASARAHIQGVETTVNDKGAVTTKFRLTDKTKNRELLGKRHGMFVDKVEHSGQLTLEQMVSASLVKPEGPIKEA